MKKTIDGLVFAVVLLIGGAVLEYMAFTSVAMSRTSVVLLTISGILMITSGLGFLWTYIKLPKSK